MKKDRTLDEGAKMEPKIPVEDEAGESLEPKRSVVNDEESDFFLPSMSDFRLPPLVLLLLYFLDVGTSRNTFLFFWFRIGVEVKEQTILSHIKETHRQETPEKTERALGFPRKEQESSQL